MDTKKYTKRIKKILIILGISFLLWGCPLCLSVPHGYNVIIPGLIKITPLDSLYHQGDTIIISVRFPSRMPDGSVNNDTVDIYETTGERSAAIVSELHTIIEPNTYEILEGKFIDRQVYVEYYDAVDEYRFKARVIFNLTGNYDLRGGSLIEFPLPPENPKCNKRGFFSINTTIEGADTTGYIRFTVLP